MTFDLKLRSYQRCPHDCVKSQRTCADYVETKQGWCRHNMSGSTDMCFSPSGKRLPLTLEKAN